MNLNTKISGITLKNPLMPASGPIVGDEEKMKYLWTQGVGAMVTKTISTKAAEVPRPCIYGEKDMLMNAELWSEHSLEHWVNHILPQVKKDIDVPLIISAGYTREDMEKVIPMLDEYADAFEISTHYVGKDLQAIGETVKTIRSRTEKPVYMKMSPHIPDPVGFARIAKENGASGIVAINSLGPTMKINIKNRCTPVGNDAGQVWTSGPVIKPVALALVNMIREAIPDFTIIGVGGIRTADDIIEFLLAGADAVQMLSSALLYGKDLYGKLLKDLPGALEKYGFSSVEEVVSTRLVRKEVTFDPDYPEVNAGKCTACGLCEKVCPYFAMEVKEKACVDKNKCFGCGLCESRCPVKAIHGVVER